MHTQRNFMIQGDHCNDNAAKHWHPAGIDSGGVSPLKAQIIYAFHMGASCGRLPAMAEKFSVSIQMLKDSLADLLRGQFLLHSVAGHKATFALTTKGAEALRSIAERRPEFITFTDQLLQFSTPYSPLQEGH